MSFTNDAEVEPAMIQLMNDCWKEDPELRPDFKQVKSLIKQMTRGRLVKKIFWLWFFWSNVFFRSVNLMDHVLKMMEKYAGNLEQTVADRTRQLTDEMKKSDLLLYRMLPKYLLTNSTTYSIPDM